MTNKKRKRDESKNSEEIKGKNQTNKEDKTIDFSVTKKLEENLIDDINNTNQVVKKMARRKLEDNHYKKKH